MTTTISKVISRAASQIGKYFPNESPYGIWYSEKHGKVYRNAQFCAMGLSWVFAKEDALDIFPKHAYTPSGAQWFKSKGRWHTGSINNIKRGDILFFDFPGEPHRISHVGIAEKNGSNGRVQTIEFNTSSTVNGDQRNGRTVARKIRTGSIVGWGRPAYKKAPKKVTTKPMPISKRDSIKPLQQAVGAYGDNIWGKDTDTRLAAVRAASAFGGVKFPYGVSYTQAVVGARRDGVWGSESRRKHDAKVIAIAGALARIGLYKGRSNGTWTAELDAAYKRAREIYRVN